jgi:hypothetical protein
LDSSIDGKECCKQIQTILTASNDQITESLGDKTLSTIEEKIIPGNYSFS